MTISMKLGALPITLRQLQYVVAVAEAHNFRRAAAECLVSQPALSAQVAEAEAALGTRLFERDRRGVLVMPAGAELVERARGILVAVEDLLESARRHADPLAGRLRIGVIPTIGPYLLPELDPALRRAFPRLDLLWIEDKTAALVRMIQAGELDAAVVARESQLGDLEYEVLAEDPFVLATALGHPLARAKRPARLGDLEHAAVLLLEDGHCFRDQALDLCSRAGARELGFRATSLATLARMVAGGAGITLLPRLAVEVENRRGGLAIREFCRPVPGRTLVLAWRRRSALAASLRAVAEAARRALSAPPAARGRPRSRASRRPSSRASRG
jgi:LysR family hydrogen peroxide-inducible transcriptional activator